MKRLLAVVWMALPALLPGQQPRGLAAWSWGRPGLGGYRLLLPGPARDPGPKLSWDPRWIRLEAFGVRREPLPDLEFNRAVTRSGLTPALTRWILATPEGKALVSGPDLPDPEAMEAALRSTIGVPPWERLEKTLREDPDQGEARLAAAEWAFAKVPLVPPRTAAAWKEKSEAEAEARRALDALLRVPGWPEEVELVDAPEGQLGARLLQHRMFLNEFPERLAEACLAALAEDPGNLQLQGNLVLVLRLVSRDQADQLADRVEALEPFPGQAWPPLPLLAARAETLRAQLRWAELLDRAPGWSRTMDRLYLNPERWDRHLLREGTVSMYTAMARSWREGWQILPGALDELRRTTGPHYRSLAAFLLRGAQLPDFPPDDDRRRLFERAARSPLPSPPMPPPLPPWALDIQDPIQRARLRESLGADPSLVSWLPTEIRLGANPPAPRLWSLRLGTADLTPTDSAPSPGVLSDLLRQGRRGRLWTASEVVAKAPDVPGKRRFRAPVLLERMPCRALESVLAEDLRRALQAPPLPVGEWDEDLWFVEAQKAIPALEEHLRRWPLDGARWAALAFWTSWVPSHRGPVALAGVLPGFRAGAALVQDLPTAVHAQVGEALQRRKAWNPLIAWFTRAGEGLDSRGHGSPAGPPRDEELAQVVRANLDAAYAALGREGDRRRLREGWIPTGESGDALRR